MKSPKDKICEILKLADIEVNGSDPWDMKVLDERLYSRLLSGGSLALGESYMDGWWEVEDMSEFFTKVVRAKLNQKVKPILMLPYVLKAKLFNNQNRKKAFEVCEEHYDIGNDLYKKMLDKRMVYTCGYWSDADNLEEAQENKLDLVCKKIGLKPGMKVLDIGCGWGSFAKYASEKYGVSVVGITLSKEQLKLAEENCKNLPVEIRFQDYRDVDEEFDAIVSIGMFEAVGPKNFKEYFKVVSKNLKDDGLFLLHTIGSHVDAVDGDPWSDKYIFPNGVIPSMSLLTKASDPYFDIEDLHNFGPDYDKTLMAWWANFDSSWDELRDKYGDRFYRMWKYYLHSFAGAFRARHLHLWQFVMSKDGLEGGYKSIR